MRLSSLRYPAYDGVAHGIDRKQPIDTAHANRFPWALIDLYRAGIVFSKDDVLGLADLLNEVIWNQSLSNPMFKNFIDGSNGSFLNRERLV